MDTWKFTHQKFYASNWEARLKKFVDSLDLGHGEIWHRKRECKKINEELVVLGYYVKYRYAYNEKISFELNEVEAEADGWIYQNDSQMESVQIAISYYDQEEADLDKRIMEGEDIVSAGWVGDRIEVLKNRVKNRIKVKVNKKYQNIDTLLIGMRDYFVRRINNEYKDQKSNLVKYMNSYIQGTKFQQFALVDTDFVGEGELLIVRNKSLPPAGR